MGGSRKGQNEHASHSKSRKGWPFSWLLFSMRKSY